MLSQMIRFVLLFLAILLLPLTACMEAQEISTPEGAIGAWYEGEHELAIDRFRALLTRDPDNPELRMSLLVLLREAGRMDEAAAVAAQLREVASRMPDGVVTMEELATLLLTGRPREALRRAGELPDGAYDGSGEAGEVGAVSASQPVRSASASADNWEPGLPSSLIGSRLLFWEGVARMLNGDTTGARERFAGAAELESHFPYAYLFQGEMHLRQGSYADAVTLMERALSQERNLTGALLPLARAKRALGLEEEAYRILRRAEIALPWNERVPALREEWERESPPLLAGRERARAEERARAVPPVVAVELTEREAIPRVRVGLAEEVRSLFIKTGGSYVVMESAPDLASASPEDRSRLLAPYLKKPPLLSGAGGEVLEIRSGEGGLRILDDGETLRLISPAPLRLIYEEPGSTTTVFDLTYGEGQFFAGRADRSYRGDLELLPRDGGAFTLVNELNVEEYLYSVVPSEMPSYWPEEALRAQAVAARSYTLHSRNRYRSRGFDLLSSVASAHYSGVTGEHSRTTAAVRETRGEVLVSTGRILDAVYSANSAGYTESSESVWGSVTPLVGVSDPLLPPLQERRSPAELYSWLLRRPESYSSREGYSSPSAYRWKILVPREEIERRLGDRGLHVGTIEAIRPGPRGITGRVESVTISGSAGEVTVNRDAIRSALGGLRSNLFLLTPQLSPEGEVNSFLFEGAGWGHGVGMCQSGAAGMADAGFGHREILGHYYPRSELQERY